MVSSLFSKSISDLLAEAWILIYDEETDRPVGIGSVLGQWTGLNWAEQTYYRAKYGFNEVGILTIALSDILKSVDFPGFAFCPHLLRHVPLPEELMPGSNNRLRNILSGTRVDMMPNPCQDDSIVHFGPDKSTIVTNLSCWGPSLGYRPFEIREDSMCYWEDDPGNWVPIGPWWATDPEAFVI